MHNPDAPGGEESTKLMLGGFGKGGTHDEISVALIGDGVAGQSAT